MLCQRCGVYLTCFSCGNLVTAWQTWLRASSSTLGVRQHPGCAHAHSNSPITMSKHRNESVALKTTRWSCEHAGKDTRSSRGVRNSLRRLRTDAEIVPILFTNELFRLRTNRHGWLAASWANVTVGWQLVIAVWEPPDNRSHDFN